MSHRQEPIIRKRSQDSFHSLRLARRNAHRNSKAPLKRRSQQAEVRRRRATILMLFTVAMGFELAAAALTSPLFGISRITVRGTEQLPERELAITEHAAWLPPGTNLFCAPIGSIERRLEALPWIRSAHVQWKTNHALAVTIGKRVPAAAVTIGGAQYEVDEGGIPIRPTRPEALESLPKVEIQQDIRVRFGVPINSEALHAAISVYRDAPRQPMARIAKIIIDPEGNMCLNMLDEMQVKFGRPEEIAAKLRYLSRVYELEPNVAGRIMAINLSVPKQPACTLKRDVAHDPAATEKEPQKQEPNGADGDVAM
jgi:cell division protein FtsQ